MKKRILMILTAVSLMAAGLTGCAASETKETQAPASETSAETVRESDGETSEEKAAETGYEAGVTSETSWSSEWLNMKFIPGEGVTLLSEEEKEMVLPAGDDTFVYEMMAANADGTASIGVVVEKSELSPEEYMEIMKEQLQGDNMEGMAFQVIQDITDREFSGRPVKYMQVDSSYQKVTVRHTYMIYARDGYLVEMIGTGVPESPEALEMLMASFTTLE